MALMSMRLGTARRGITRVAIVAIIIIVIVIIIVGGYAAVSRYFYNKD